MSTANMQVDEMHSVNSASRDFFCGRISPWTIRSWIRLGKLPSFKAGSRVLIRRSDLEAIMKPREAK
jgi:excisionase family DNA binding protein